MGGYMDDTPQEITSLVGREVYSNNGVFVGEVEDLRLNVGGEAVTGLALGGTQLRTLRRRSHHRSRRHSAVPVGTIRRRHHPRDRRRRTRQGTGRGRRRTGRVGWRYADTDTDTDAVHKLASISPDENGPS
ncbi:PRC-barrel domain-containing protein [Saliphagus sp. GCM10025317]